MGVRSTRAPPRAWDIALDMPAGVSAPFGYFDPAGLGKKVTEKRAKYFRECELKHGRVAMLAAFGFPVAEHFHPLFVGNIDVPSYVAYQQTPLQTFWPVVCCMWASSRSSPYSRSRTPSGRAASGRSRTTACPVILGGTRWTCTLPTLRGASRCRPRS